VILVVNGSSFLDEISQMIADRRQELRRIEILQAEIESLEASARMFREKHGVGEMIEAGELKGKTQMAALIYIARKSNGLLRVNEVKRMMVQVGLIGTPKNAASILYTLIKRSERFDRVEPGVYRLRESNVMPMKMA